MVAVPFVKLTETEFHVYYSGESIANVPRIDDESTHFVLDGSLTQWKIVTLGKNRITIIKGQESIFSNRVWYLLLNKNTGQMECRSMLQCVGDDFADIWDQCGHLVLFLWTVFKVNKPVLISIMVVVVIPLLILSVYSNKQTNIMYPGNVLVYGDTWIINDEYSVKIESCRVWLTRVLIGNLTVNHKMTPRLSTECNYPFLMFQSDGNLVLYERSTNSPLWASGTNGKGYKKVTIDLIKGEFIF